MIANTKITIITIIVPIYNVERYIERCVRSLMEQTMTEGIEFLFVNDCTPDRSMEILRKVVADYPQRQSQIRIIENTTNMGVSATRKLGVREARGEYIGWCDADDWCDVDMYRQMIEKTRGMSIDMVISDYYEDYEDHSDEMRWKEYSKPSECFLKMRTGYSLPGSLWQQICRKEIVERCINQIFNVNYAEDVYTIILETYYAQSIAYTGTAFYHHTNENQASLLHNINYRYEDWLKQKRNIELISSIYSPRGREFEVACSSLKLSFKEKFRSAFSSLSEYYQEFREAYRDINEIYFTPSSQRVKTYLVYNVYPLFWWYNRKTWNT